MHFNEAQSNYKKCQATVDQCRQSFIIEKNICDGITKELNESLNNKPFHQTRLDQANVKLLDKQKAFNIAEQEKCIAFDLYVKLGKEMFQANFVAKEPSLKVKWRFCRGDCVTHTVEVIESGHKYTVIRPTFRDHYQFEAMESKYLFDTEEQAVQADAEYLYHAKRNMEACLKMAYDEGDFNDEQRLKSINKYNDMIEKFHVKDPREIPNGNTIN